MSILLQEWIEWDILLAAWFTYIANFETCEGRMIYWHFWTSEIGVQMIHEVHCTGPFAGSGMVVRWRTPRPTPTATLKAGGLHLDLKGGRGAYKKSFICHHTSSYFFVVHHISTKLFHHSLSYFIICHHDFSSYFNKFISSYFIIVYQMLFIYFIIFHHVSSCFIICHHTSSYVIVVHYMNHMSSYVIIFHHISS